MKDDLISRQSMMAHFATSQALVNDHDVLYCNGVLDVISREPSVDAVPVVRCRECKYNEDEEYCPFVRVSKGKNWLEIVKPPAEGFCHKGEKMDGGAEG